MANLGLVPTTPPTLTINDLLPGLFSTPSPVPFSGGLLGRGQDTQGRDTYLDGLVYHDPQQEVAKYGAPISAWDRLKLFGSALSDTGNAFLGKPADQIAQTEDRMRAHNQQVAQLLARQSLDSVFSGQGAAPANRGASAPPRLPFSMPPLIQSGGTGRGGTNSSGTNTGAAASGPGLPSLNSVLPTLLAAARAGLPIAPYLDLLKSNEPDIAIGPDGKPYDKKDPSTLSRTFANPTNINGFVVNQNDPNNMNRYFPKLEEGQEPLYDRNGNVVGVRTIDGALKSNSDLSLSKESGPLALQGQKDFNDSANQPFMRGPNGDLIPNAGYQNYQRGLIQDRSDASVAAAAQKAAEAEKAAQYDLNDPEDKSYINSIANYRVRAPSAGRNPAQRRAAISAALKVNPDYNEGLYDQSAKALKDFGTGKQGDTARSLNVSVAHLQTLLDLGDALNNGDISVVNAVKQRFAEEFGVPAPTNFDAARAIVADEVAKGVIGGQTAQSDRETLAASLRRERSPQAIKGAVQTFQSLLGGQLGGLRDQYKRTTRANDFDQAFLSDQTRKALGVNPTPTAGNSPGGPVSGRGNASDPLGLRGQ